MTKKARLIKKMTALSDKEKAQAISFFSKYPNYENRIDWNRRNLQYSDFEKVFKMRKNSVNNKKRKEKKNPGLLFEKYNCQILCKTEDFLAVVPLDWECAVFFNSFNCGGEGAKWCIGDRKCSFHWNSYVHSKNVFVLVYFYEKQPVFGKKFIIQYDTLNRKFTFWLKNDTGINSQIRINLLYYIFTFLSKIKKIKANINIYSSLFSFIHNEIPIAAVELVKKTSIYPQNPLRLEIGSGLTTLVDTEEKQKKIMELIKNMRREIARNTGIILPAIRIIDNLQLKHNEYQFIIKERYAGGDIIQEGYEAEELLAVIINNIFAIINYNMAEISLFSEIMED